MVEEGAGWGPRLATIFLQGPAKVNNTLRKTTTRSTRCLSVGAAAC
jgi:hypothetical protein